MSKEILIHKINITDEAKCDVGESLDIQGFDWSEMKTEVEEYITHQTKENRTPWWGYFRCKYYDEDSDKMLMLFFYRGDRLSIMQFWNLVGICLAEDWTQDAEDNGEIRNWLKCRITDLSEEEDWVIAYRVNRIIKETNKTKYEEVLKEVLNEFDCERDKEVAEQVAFLQSYYFEFSGIPVKAKVRINRKSGKSFR